MARDVAAVVPAAGLGLRLGTGQSKALVALAGKPLLLHTLQALQDTASIGWIIVVVRTKDQAPLRRLLKRNHLAKVSAIVTGASSRASSVARGVKMLPSQAKWVVIHDGARPCVRPSLIESVIRQAKRSGAVACGLPASLAVKAVDQSQHVRLTLDRSGLWFIQTPQAFRRDWLHEALSRADHALDSFPDDAAILEWAGFPVRVVPGDPLNIKVTAREDLMLAEAILRGRSKK